MVLLTLALAQFMVVLDVSIVNVALPSVQKALNFSVSNLQWVVTAYTLAFGGFLLLGGRTADLIGRRKVFLLGLTGFVLGSLVAGLSQNEAMLIIARGLQGLAGAFMSPAALSIVLNTFKEGEERNRALSVWGAIASGGAAAGVLLGGLLTEYLSWRWNFLVNLPVGVIATVLALRYVPESKADLGHRNFDLFGSVSVTAGLMLLVYGLTKAPTEGWLSTHTIGFLGGAVVLLVAFLINEARIRNPLMPLRIFRVGNVSAANLTQLPITASLFAMFFFLTLYIQNVLGYTPVTTGLSFLPVTFAIGLSATLASPLIKKIGYKPILVVAPLLMAAGLFMLGQVPTNGGSYLTDILPGLLVMSAGLGMSFVSITIAATTGVPARDSGLASGLLNTAQQVGGSLGLAILSAVAASATTAALAGAITPAAIVAAQVDGYHHAFFTGAGFALAASVIALLLIRRHKGESAGEQSVASPTV